MGERKQVEGPFFFCSEGNTIALKRCYCSKSHSRAQAPPGRLSDCRWWQERLPFAGITNCKAALHMHELSIQK